jgi:type IV secretory pathway TrbF-like protein
MMARSRCALVCQGLLRVMHLRCMVLMANVKLRRSFCQSEKSKIFPLIFHKDVVEIPYGHLFKSVLTEI